jgi:hypothetical protein
MSTVVPCYERQSVPTEQSGLRPQSCDLAGLSLSCTTPVYRQQIQDLIQQLFFQHENAVVRHVGVTAAENSTDIAPLCFDVAQVLAEESQCDVGLIDASPESLPLETQLRLEPPETPDSAWPIAPHLWLVPRQNWISMRRLNAELNTTRLRELALEFDFSILYCPSVSWLAARIGRACDGLVLVLTANRTRGLVAGQTKNQLQKAKVPLLGTVLVERRFPIPEALYRRL